MRQLFKGDNYSREETINLQDFFSVTTIQGRQVFKGGNYSRKYGIWPGIKKNLICRILLLVRPIHYIEAVITITFQYDTLLRGKIFVIDSYFAYLDIKNVSYFLTRFGTSGHSDYCDEYKIRRD